MVLTEEEFSVLTPEEKKRYLNGIKANRGKRELYFLLTEILGYKEIDEDVHGELIESLDLPEKKKLILMPRGTFKTTVVTIGRTVQRIIRDGNIRVLLDSEVLDYSEKILGQIKRELQKPKFIELYGNLIDPKRRETSREFTVTTRKNMGIKEPTIFGGGIGTVQNGPHYDYIIADDLHSEKNVNTSEQIDKVISHYRLLLSLLEPGGEIVIIGTRWHFRDLYSFILEEEAAREAADWMVLKQSAINEDGSLFFPNRLTREFLDSQRRAQGAYLFSVLYLNEPSANEDAVFKKDDFRYWEGGDFPMQDGRRVLLNISMCVDRAFSTKESADYTGVTVSGMSASGNVYVLEAIRKKCGLQELFDLLVSLGGKYGWDRIRKVGVETINFEELQQFFQECMKKQNRFFIFERLIPDGKQSKYDRIEKALQARFANHGVYLKKGQYDLEDELIRFPVATHDDLIDSLAYSVRLLNAPSDPTNEENMNDYQPSGLFGRTGY